MKEFEIMFDDLKPEAQVKFLEFVNMDDPSDGNYDTFPIAIIENYDEDECDQGFYDEVGGYHDGGVGWSPKGVLCGECTFVSCKDCPTAIKEKGENND